MRHDPAAVPTHRLARSALAFAGLAALALASAPASADPGILLAAARPGDSDSLGAGDQLLLEDRSGPLSFAGRALVLDGFTGILGYSSEAAYILVIDGRVMDGARRVTPGKMLLIPPYGTEPSVQRFDAARLRASWSEAARQSRPDTYARLGSIAAGQNRGLFLGRLSRTAFNVAAPAGVDDELAGRTVRGADAVQAIRFSGESDPAAIERRVVDTFLAALAAGDVEGVAALMDPVPFGNTDLRGGAADARLAMARLLIGQRDWAGLLREASVARQGAGNVWTLSAPDMRGTLALRPMGDFVFVRTIEVGGL